MLAKNLSPNTIRINLAPLTNALRKAVERGYVTRNVASLASTPRIVRRRDPRYLDPTESRAVLEACAESRFGDAIALTMLLGLRRGEVLGLCWDRVTLDGDRATVTIDRQLTDARQGPVTGKKTGSKGRRAIVLPRVAVDVLQRRLERQRFEERAAPRMDGVTRTDWYSRHRSGHRSTLATPAMPSRHSPSELSAARSTRMPFGIPQRRCCTRPG